MLLFILEKYIPTILNINETIGKWYFGAQLTNDTICVNDQLLLRNASPLILQNIDFRCEKCLKT